MPDYSIACLGHLSSLRRQVRLRFLRSGNETVSAAGSPDSVNEKIRRMQQEINVVAGQWWCPFKYSAIMPDGEPRTVCGYKRERLSEFGNLCCFEHASKKVSLPEIDCPLQHGPIVVQLMFPRKTKKTSFLKKRRDDV